MIRIYSYTKYFKHGNTYKWADNNNDLLCYHPHDMNQSTASPKYLHISEEYGWENLCEDKH
jgi:hypothetical protein